MSQPLYIPLSNNAFARFVRAINLMDEIRTKPSDASMNRLNWRIIQVHLDTIQMSIGDFLNHYYAQQPAAQATPSSFTPLSFLPSGENPNQTANSTTSLPSGEGVKEGFLRTCRGCDHTFTNPKVWSGHGEKRCMKKNGKEAPV